MKCQAALRACLGCFRARPLLRLPHTQDTFRDQETWSNTDNTRENEVGK